MAYKVPLKKLVKIVNPFEHNIFKDIQLSIEDIESKLNTLDIFPNVSDTKEERTIKEIAYKVANYEQGLIKVRLPEMGEVLEEVLLFGSIDLCAAIYRQEEFLNVELIATPKIAKTLLGVDMHNEQVDFTPEVTTPILFNWKIPGDLDKTWHNPEFILQKILAEGSFSEGLKLFQDSIPNEIINTTTFAEVFCKKRFIISLPQEWLYKPNFFNIIKSESSLFLHTWNTSYSTDYQSFLDDKINIKDQHDQYITCNAIRNGVFNNKDFCKDLIQHEDSMSKDRHMSYGFSTIFKYFHHSVIFDSYFMNLNYFNNPSGYNRYNLFSIKDVPEAISSSPEWQKDFIINFQNFSALTTEELAPFVKILSGSKEKILYSLDKNPSLYSIYSLLSPNMTSNPDIIEAFVNANSKVYLALNSTFPEKSIYLTKFLNEYPYLYTEVPFEDIIALNSKDIFKILVGTDYKILNHKKFPKEFKDDTSVLLMAKANLKYLGDKRIEKLLFKNIEVAKQLCAFDSLFYWKAPLDLKRNPEFALEQLKNNGDIEMYLFASKDFCINALKINEKLADKIPVPYWDDLKFITTLVEFIDANTISKKVFDFAPPKVREFLDSCNIDSDFTYFFNKVLLKENFEQKNTSAFKDYKVKKL